MAIKDIEAIVAKIKDYSTNPRFEEYLDYLDQHITGVQRSCEEILIPALKEKDGSLSDEFIGELQEQMAEHDKSKYGEEEFEPYCNYFYPCEGHKKDTDAFDIAWLHHQHENPHHHQHWVLIRDGGEKQPVDMPLNYIYEMLCDWHSFTLRNPKSTAKAWWKDNKKDMVLSDTTIKIIEDTIDLFENPLEKLETEKVDESVMAESANKIFNDKYFPQVNILDTVRFSGVYEYKGRKFIYDKKNALLIQIFKDSDEVEELGEDKAPWRELDSIGFSKENWDNKDIRDEYLFTYSMELDDEADYAIDQAKKEFGITEAVDLVEDVEIHDKLNKKLWNEDMTLKPEAKEKIIEIADEFKNSIKDYLDLNIIDIQLVGSNASYNYTDNSDIDIHIITDFSDYGDPDAIVEAAMNASKTNFNNNYDIEFSGHDVEIYVEDIKSATMSNGIYSVINDEWVKKPEKLEIPEVDLEPLLTDTRKEANEILQSGSADDIVNEINKLYLMRKNSLASDGEFGVGNLVFKEIRNDGLLDGLKNKKLEIRSNELSLENVNTEEITEDIKSDTSTNDDELFKFGGKLQDAGFDFDDYHAVEIDNGIKILFTAYFNNTTKKQDLKKLSNIIKELDFGKFNIVKNIYFESCGHPDKDNKITAYNVEVLYAA